MNPIFIKLGPLEIRYYGLMYAIAFLVGIHFAKKAG
nr:prolipoprotein diacylglyceryl transferase [Fusobacteriaceae bacterium]